MIRNYFWVIYIAIERIIIENTQQAHDVPGKSPKGILKVLTSETYRCLSGDQCKIWWFYEKVIFRK